MLDPISRIMKECGKNDVLLRQAVDHFEMSFELWINKTVGVTGFEAFIKYLNIYPDDTFNLIDYVPTKANLNKDDLCGIESIGLDLIGWTDRGEAPYWLLVSVLDPNHTLEGVRYIVGFDGTIVRACIDPLFTEKCPEESIIVNGNGIFIDTEEKFLKLTVPGLYEDISNVVR